MTLELSRRGDRDLERDRRRSWLEAIIIRAAITTLTRDVMSFFRRKKKPVYQDISLDNPSFWDVQNLKQWTSGKVTAITWDPVLSVYACGKYIILVLRHPLSSNVGLSIGEVHLYGGPGVHFRFTLPEKHSVKQVQINSASRKLIAIGKAHLLATTLY